MFPLRPGNKLLSLLLLQIIAVSLFAQKKGYDAGDWMQTLNSSNNKTVADFIAISDALKTMDSSSTFNVLHKLEQEGKPGNKYFDTRIKLLQAYALYHHMHRHADAQIDTLLKQALHQAYVLDDIYLQYEVCRIGTEIFFLFNKIEPSVLYGLTALDLDDQYHIDPTSYVLRFIMGEMLYHVREYKTSIRCSAEAIDYYSQPGNDTLNCMMAWNTIGLCWQKMNQYEEAIKAYANSIKLATTLKNEVWMGIPSGNMGQVYCLQRNYAKAKPLLEYDYQTSKRYGEFDNAANSLQWVAKISLAQGYKDSALLQVKEALLLLQKKPDPRYFRNLYYTTADVYSAFNNRDSFYHYFQLYSTLHDSLEKVSVLSPVEIVRLKTNNEKDFYAIKKLQAEKKHEELMRNFSIAIILLFSGIGILVFNRQRMKSKYNTQLALQQEAMAKAEIAAAQNQLNIFTQNVLEKTNIIERLEQELQGRNVDNEQDKLITELRQQNIFTDDDWQQFKLLFEKVYPAFFTKLKDKVSDITVSEQRMAAFTRLHLTTKEISSMLAISPASVYKTKQRLRQRLHLDTETSMEEFIAQI